MKAILFGGGILLALVSLYFIQWASSGSVTVALILYSILFVLAAIFVHIVERDKETDDD